MGQTFSGTEKAPELQALSPDERTKEYRRLARQAKSSDAAQQLSVSNDLVRQLQSEDDPRIRAEILHALANYPTDVAEAALRAGLQDTDADVRIACCRGWGRRGGTAAVQALGGAVAGDTNVDVRIAAAQALGDVGRTEAIQPLAPLLEDDDPALQYVAVQSLQKVTDRDLGNDVNAWRMFVQGREPVPPPEQSIASRWLGWLR